MKSTTIIVSIAILSTLCKRTITSYELVQEDNLVMSE